MLSSAFSRLLGFLLSFSYAPILINFSPPLEATHPEHAPVIPRHHDPASHTVSGAEQYPLQRNSALVRALVSIGISATLVTSLTCHSAELAADSQLWKYHSPLLSVQFVYFSPGLLPPRLPRCGIFSRRTRRMHILFGMPRSADAHLGLPLPPTLRLVHTEGTSSGLWSPARIL